MRRGLEPPRTLRPTRAGWIFFALTFGVGFAALNTGNNLLYLVLSLMLAFLVLSGVLSEAALRGVRVRRRLPAEVVAGAPAPVVLEIANHQRRVPAFAVAVEDIAARDLRRRRAPALGRVFALRVAPGETERRVYRLSAERRGWLQLGGFRVSTRFPFGLFSKALRIEQGQRVLVYPRLEPVAAPAWRSSAPRRGSGAAGVAGPGGDVSGLREFARGDSFRRIHWRVSARRGALLVRDVEAERRVEIEVRLRTAGVIDPDAFEREVSWTASEAAALLEAGARVGLRTDAERVPAASGRRQRARCLAFLAQVQPDAAARAGPGAPAASARDAAAAGPRAAPGAGG